MKQARALIGIVILIIAAYYWYRRFDTITNPNFYGELITPIILTLVGGYLLICTKSKDK